MINNNLTKNNGDLIKNTWKREIIGRTGAADYGGADNRMQVNVMMSHHESAPPNLRSWSSFETGWSALSRSGVRVRPQVVEFRFLGVQERGKNGGGRSTG